MVKDNKDLSILIAQYKNGDSTAFDEIYKRCYSDIAFICSKLCDNKEDIEESIQDTFVILFKKLDTLDANTLIPYLRKIAANNCFKKYRDNKKHTNSVDIQDYENESLTELGQDFLPEKYLECRESQSEMLKIINALPPKQKKMIYLYYYAGINTEEIARLNNCTSANVRKILYTARNTIKSKMESGQPTLKCVANASLASVLLAEEQIFAASHAAATAATATSAVGSVLTVVTGIAAVCILSVVVYFGYSAAGERDIAEPTVVIPYVAEPLPDIVHEQIAEAPVIDPIYEYQPVYQPEEEYAPMEEVILVKEVNTQVEIPHDPEPYEPEPYEIQYYPETAEPEEYEPEDEPPDEDEPPTHLDRTAEILAALSIATTPKEVSRIITYYDFVRAQQMQRFSGERFLFYVLNEGSGDILIGIAEHEPSYYWRMQFDFYENAHIPSDELVLFYWMDG